MKVSRVEVIQAYQRVFRSPEGEKVLTDMFKRFGMLSTTQVDGDAQASAFHEGQRAVVLEVIRILKMNANELLNRLRESEDGGSGN